MSPSRPLYHAIRTHASSHRANAHSGFRTLFLAPWPPTDRQRISRWLEGLSPRRDGPEWEEARSDGPRELAVAVNCFRIAGTLHACLARLDDRFRRDEHGRGGGAFTHALFAPLDESRPAGAWGPALLAASRTFLDGGGEEGALDDYLDRCRRTSTIDWPDALDPDVWEAVDQELLQRFCELAERGGSRGDEALVPAPCHGDLPRALLDAGALVPPRLRLACRWGVGLQPGADLTFVARPVPGGIAATGVAAGAAARYCDWLERQQRLGRWDRVAEAAGHWHLRSWDDLLRWTARST